MLRIALQAGELLANKNEYHKSRDAPWRVSTLFPYVFII